MNSVPRFFWCAPGASRVVSFGRLGDALIASPALFPHHFAQTSGGLGEHVIGLAGSIRYKVLVSANPAPMLSPFFPLSAQEKSSHILFLSLLCAALFFPGLGARDFWAPVEPRYAEIARVMFARGEWIVPTVNGDLYTDKPILFFWLVLVGAKVFGAVNEWTVRLPAALGGTGFVLATYLLGRDFFNARTSWIGAAVLATSMRVIWEARWAHVDMVFCTCFMLSIYFGARALLRESGRYAILPAYIFMGLATLSKGLIGVVLPGLLFAAFVLLRRDWALIRNARLHLGVPLFFLIVTPWYFTVTQATGGKWLTDFIYIHHVQRYAAGAGHRQPFYYYLTTLPVDFLPWTVFLIPALFVYRPYRYRFADPVVQLFLLWFLTVFLFFSISNTKRDLYLLPLMPTLALFVGKFFDDLANGQIAQSSVFQWLAIVFFGFTAIAGIGFPLVAAIMRQDALATVFPCSAVLFVGGFVTVYFVRRRWPLMIFSSIAALMALTTISAAIWIMPYLENFKSPRPFARQVARMVTVATPLYIYADTMDDFNYYMGRELIPVLPTPAAVDALLARRQDGYLLVKERDLRRLAMLPRRWIVVSDENGSTTWHLLRLQTRP
jgi:4-amino-4-deoxy-L-arabinose transferase-like glycosyltransferase